MMCSSLKFSIIYFKDNSDVKVESKEKQPVASADTSTSEKNDTETKENTES